MGQRQQIFSHCRELEMAASSDEGSPWLVSHKAIKNCLEVEEAPVRSDQVQSRYGGLFIWFHEGRNELCAEDWQGTAGVAAVYEGQNI